MQNTWFWFVLEPTQRNYSNLLPDSSNIQYRNTQNSQRLHDQEIMHSHYFLEIIRAHQAHFEIQDRDKP